MMSAEFDDELLSALFDGELSAEELALVERHLDEFPSLRTRLDEYAELRKMLSSLRSLAAPADLKETILLQVRSATVTYSSRSTSGSTSQKTRRRWSPRAGVVAASIACVGVVTVWTLASRQARPKLVAEHAAETPSAVAGDAENLADGGEPASLMGEAAGSMEIASLDKRARSTPMLTGANGLGDSEALRERLLIPGQTPTPGEKLSYLDAIDEEPVVVTYSVVDVVDAFDQVQVLLEREGIHSLDGSSQQKPATSGGQLHPSVAIYLEAEPAQVEAVLKQLPVVFVTPPSVERKPGGETAQWKDERLRAPAAPSSNDIERREGPAFQFVVPIDSHSQQQLRNQPVLQKAIQQQKNRSQAEAPSKPAEGPPVPQQFSPLRQPDTAQQLSGEPAAQANVAKEPAAQGQSRRKTDKETGERVSVLLILQGEE